MQQQITFLNELTYPLTIFLNDRAENHVYSNMLLTGIYTELKAATSSADKALHTCHWRWSGFTANLTVMWPAPE